MSVQDSPCGAHERERRPSGNLEIAGFVLAALIGVMCFVLLPLFDCAFCENRKLRDCPFCKGTGKWSVVDRGRAPSAPR